MHLAPSPLIPTRGCTCRSRPLRPSKSTRSTVPHSSTAADNGGPGKREHYGPGYYAAFVVDPDGYRLEAHCELDNIV